MIIDGFTAPGFERVRDAFARNLEAGELGAAFTAMRDGDVLVDLWGGWADRAKTRPWARDTLAPVFSTTKPIAALVVAHLIDSHGLDFETPLASIWPEFSVHGKERATIAEALSHQAGVPGFVAPIDPDLWLDPQGLAAALAQEAPLWPPGGASGYHALTWGAIAGEIVRRVAGKSLGVLLRENICAARAIEFWIGLPDEHHARVAEIVRPKRFPDFGPITPAKTAAFLAPWAAPKRGGADWKRAEIPAANGHGTARAVASLYGVFAQAGFVTSERMLSQRAYDAFTAPRRAGDDLVLPFNLDWRAGVIGNSNGFYGPNRAALGHSGWGGSCGFGDPEAGVSAAYVMNAQSHHLMGDPRALHLIEALYTAL